MFTRTLRPDGKPPTLRFRPPNMHIPLWLLAAGWGLVLTGRGVWWLARHPRTTGVLTIGVVVGVTGRTAELAVLLLLVTGVACIWWAMWPGSFDQRAGAPLRTRLREHLVYRRDWQPAMLTAGLSLREAWGGDLPTLRSVRAEAGGDVLRVRMLPGQTADTWQAAAPALASTFGVRTMRVRRVPGRPQELDLYIRRTTGGTTMRHVTEPAPMEETREEAPVRPAFPRQPRGAAS